MSTKKRVLKNTVLTLIVLAFVAVKLIIWYVNDIDLSWVFSRGALFLIPYHYGIFLSALLTIITIWLPPNPQMVLGTAALYISGVILLIEGGFYLLPAIIILLSRNPLPIEAFFPFLTLGVIGILLFTTLTSDGYTIGKSRNIANKSQWIFFGSKEKTVTPMIPNRIDEDADNFRQPDVPDQTPSKLKTIMGKIGRRLFGFGFAALVVFVLFAVYLMSSYEAVLALYVVMPIVGICIVGGAVLRILAHFIEH